jgi:hypothetical protein
MSDVVDTYSWSNRERLTTDALNADQAEVEAIRQNVAATSTALYDERLAEELEFVDSDARSETRLEEQMRKDIELDSLSGRVMEEIARRRELLGSHYPFELDNGALRYTPTASGVYEFCLAISTAPSLTSEPYVQLPRYFEILAGDVVCHYMGEGSNFIRSGAPAYPADAELTNFKQTIEYLHAQTDEWEWLPTWDAEPDLPSVKDEGMDFVVWKSIDRRRGRIYVLGQCACGRTDWHEKTEDLRLNRLTRWVRDLPPVRPVRAFATPHNVTAVKVFATLARYGGLSFDRVRLTAIANSTSSVDHFITTHSAKLLELTRLVIGEARLKEAA